VVDPGPLEVPPTPEGLGPAGAAAWQSYWSDRVSLAATVADGPDIARYCALHDEREAVEAKIRGAKRYGGGHVIEGMNGPMLNPLHRVRKELTREIEKYREQLGILALPRMRLGLVAVQAEHGRRSLPPEPQQAPVPKPTIIDLDEVV
jgi:hypothetical protein